MKSLILLVALVATVAYGNYNPQAVNLVQLTSGVTVSGTIPVNVNNGYQVQTFAIWIPANASSYNINVTNTNYTACSYVYYFLRANGAACDYGSYPQNNFYCGNVPYDYATSTDNTIVIPGFRSALAEYKSGDYAYVSLGLNDGSYMCYYDLTVTVNYACGAGQTSVAQGLDSSTTTQCVNSPTVVAPSGTTTLNVNSGAVATSYIGLYSVNMPLSMAVMTVTMNITYDEVEMYGNQYSAYGYTSYYCSDTSGSSLGGGYYSYSMSCYVPRSGQFYVSLQSDSEFNGTVTFAFTQCSGGFGGYNCSFPEAPLNLTALATAPINIYVPYASDYSGYYQFIYYIDVPVNYTGNDRLFFINSAQSGYLGTRLNGYPEYSKNGYEDNYQQLSYGSGSSVFYGLSQMEYVYPGRYYFTIQCASSANGCNVSISLNSSSITTTGSQTTTGQQTTTGSSTTGSTTALTTASTTGSTTGSTTALTTATTTGSTTALTTRAVSTTASTTALTTRAALTTGVPPTVTTAAEKSGFEYVIPSFLLLLAALLF